MGDVKVIKQDSHRNGIGGAPFVVSLFEVPGESRKGDTFVAISFPYDYRHNESSRGAFIENTAVLNLAETMDGNIEMAMGNSWRGADHWGPALADAWHEKCLSDGVYKYDPFNCGHEAAKEVKA